MPILDTLVLFGASDPKDKAHKQSLEYLHLLVEPEYYLAGFALFEFDIVMKSRGYSAKDRMSRHALLARDFPVLAIKTSQLSPEVMYLAAKLEEEAGLDYFDAGVAAEAKSHDGQVVSSDGAFDKLTGIKRIW